MTTTEPCPSCGQRHPARTRPQPPVNIDRAVFTEVDGDLHPNDDTLRFDAGRAWDEYQQRPDVWDQRAAMLARRAGRPWDAVDVFAASVGPWWVPIATGYTVLPDEPATLDVLGGYEPDPTRWHHLVGEIETTYARLVELFGQPNDSVRDPHKTDAAWAIQFPDGLIADIYNYKDGPAYLGADGTPPRDITEWHVGARDDAVFTRVTAIVQPSGWDAEEAS